MKDSSIILKPKPQKNIDKSITCKCGRKYIMTRVGQETCFKCYDKDILEKMPLLPVRKKTTSKKTPDTEIKVNKVLGYPVLLRTVKVKKYGVTKDTYTLRNRKIYLMSFCHKGRKAMNKERLCYECAYKQENRQ